MRLPAALPAPAFRTRPQDADTRTHTHTLARCTDNGVVGRWATVGYERVHFRVLLSSTPRARLVGALRPNSASCVCNNKSYAKAEIAAQRPKVCSKSVKAIAHCISLRSTAASASQQPLMRFSPESCGADLCRRFHPPSEELSVSFAVVSPLKDLCW